MKKNIGIEELKKIQLDILCHVDVFCKENNIQYFACGGTLIGTVRHHGYIPWDDDIDIMMLRSEYERFMSEYFSKDNSEYKLYNHKILKDYILPFAKIANSKTVIKEPTEYSLDYGINIDIFPIDKLPDDRNEQVQHYAKLKRLIDIHGLKLMSVSKERSLFKNIILSASHIVLSPISIEYLNKRIEKLARKYETLADNKYCGISVWGYGTREINLSSNYKSSQIAPFEDTMVPIPVGYDNYLSCVYGDYMKLPPLEKQCSHHIFEAWWKL